ncbi:hypothetical protein BKG85_22260 [Mycobacteroides chelonae]|nr:hypothetical protein BKG85_22260 [Mycobacteroides chelonae]
MFLGNLTATQGGSDIRQHRCQYLAGERAARGELFGIGDTPAGRTLADMQPPGNHVRIRGATQLHRGTMLHELRNAGMRGGQKPALQHLNARQHREQFGVREPFDRFRAEGIDGRLQRLNRIHVRILTTPTDKNAEDVTDEIYCGASEFGGSAVEIALLVSRAVSGR